MKSRILLPLAGLAAFAFLPFSLAGAAPITVPNASFESPVASGVTGYATGNGGGHVNWYSFGDSTSWSSTHQNEFAWIPAKSSNDTTKNVGLQVPSVLNAGAAGVVIANPHGNQYVYLNSNGGWASITSPSLGAVQANTIYTLTVALGHRSNFSPSQYDISLLADGSSIATTTVVPSQITAGQWADFQVVFDTSLNPSSVGKSLAIEFKHSLVGTVNQANGNNIQGLFDNVRLDATAIPEPSAAIVAGLGLLAAAFSRRRQR